MGLVSRHRHRETVIGLSMATRLPQSSRFFFFFLFISVLFFIVRKQTSFSIVRRNWWICESCCSRGWWWFSRMLHIWGRNKVVLSIILGCSVANEVECMVFWQWCRLIANPVQEYCVGVGPRAQMHMVIMHDWRVCRMLNAHPYSTCDGVLHWYDYQR